MSENRYADVPFDEIRAAPVGNFRREDVPALRSTANFFLRRFEGARCDSEAVADCVRCQAVFLAHRTLAALEGAQTVPEAAEAFVLAAEAQP